MFEVAVQCVADRCDALGPGAKSPVKQGCFTALIMGDSDGESVGRAGVFEAAPDGVFDRLSGEQVGDRAFENGLEGVGVVGGLLPLELDGMAAAAGRGTYERFGGGECAGQREQ